MARFDFLDQKHPVYERWAPIWSRMERLFRGGVYVRNELQRFDWESSPSEVTALSADPSDSLKKKGAHYAARQRQATYFNFPKLFAEVTVGHLMQKAPLPNFGSLGPIARPEGSTEPSFGELVYFNTDGVGNDGSQWHNYWGTSLQRATATGHRWHFAEAPIMRAQTVADVLAGRRPYLVELSPLRVPFWHYEAGQLQAAIVRVPPMKLQVKDGKITRSADPDYLLLVRRGYTLFDEVEDNGGIKFSNGGWWRFTGEKEFTNETSPWDKTRGEIPLFPLFWERDEGTDGPNQRTVSTTAAASEVDPAGMYEAFPAMSRPASMEIANAAVAFYNLSSAVNFELWDGAKGLVWLKGIDGDGWQLAMDKIDDGSRWIPLPMNKKVEGLVPSAEQDGSNAEVVSSFKDRLQQIREEVRELMSFESSGSPDSSGVSKQAGFGEKHSPRLARVASEVEQTQNTAIYFLELRFGKDAPSGAVEWPREFELIDFGTKIDEFLEAQQTAGVKSAKLTGRALAKKAEDAGLIDGEAEFKEAVDEYAGAVTDQRTQAQVESALLSGTGATDRRPTPPPERTTPAPSDTLPSDQPPA